MKVETFEISEMSCAGQSDFDVEQIALMEKLGLTAQLALVKPVEDVRTVFPYRKMTAEEKAVYETLCPSKCDLEAYGDMAIPTRVLQVASYVREFNLGTLKVWSSANSDVKDPVLVLEVREGYTYTFYLLARWAEMLEPFDTLRAQAVKKLKASKRSLYTRMLARIQQLKQDVDAIDNDVEALSKLPESVSAYELR